MITFVKLSAFSAGAAGLVFLVIYPLIGIVLLCIGEQPPANGSLARQVEEAKRKLRR